MNLPEAPIRISVIIFTPEAIAFRWTFPLNSEDVRNASDTHALAGRAAELMGIPQERVVRYGLEYTNGWEEGAAKHRRDHDPAHSGGRRVRCLIIRKIMGK